jgi:surfeit locus 1 family protein
MISSMTDPLKEGALRRWPMLLSAVIVLAAVAVMVRLGFWQLDRLAQKEALLARYAAASADPAVLPASYETFGRAAMTTNLYRQAVFNCTAVVGWQAVSGSNNLGQSGFAHIAECTTADWNQFDGPGRQVDVVVGWSNNPATPGWAGGSVKGRISPGGKLGLRLVADPPLAGLQANAKPNPANIANNHLAYAVQWFAFALTALVIYALALRKRLRG